MSTAPLVGSRELKVCLPSTASIAPLTTMSCPSYEVSASVMSALVVKVAAGAKHEEGKRRIKERVEAPHPGPLPIRCGEGGELAPFAPLELFRGHDSGLDFGFQVAGSWRGTYECPLESVGTMPILRRDGR